jgi:hypothetical protein
MAHRSGIGKRAQNVLRLLPNTQPGDGHNRLTIVDSFKPFEGIARPVAVAGERSSDEAFEFHRRNSIFQTLRVTGRPQMRNVSYRNFQRSNFVNHLVSAIKPAAAFTKSRHLNQQAAKMVALIHSLNEPLGRKHSNL